jgi:heme oxygenase
VDTLSTIRGRTRELHVRLESRFDPGLEFKSRENYARLLQRYLGLYRPFERGMDGLPESVRCTVSWSGREKCELLERDIEALAGTRSGEVAEMGGLPDLGDLDSVLGALYVVEGSCLGGQYLYRQVSAALGLDASSGAGFFYGYGAETGSMWKRFTSLLAQRVTDANRATDTACAMFQFFEKGLVQAQG